MMTMLEIKKCYGDEFAASYLGMELLLVEGVGPGGVDGDHDLAAQGLVLHADGVGVDQAEAPELRRKERRGWFIGNSASISRDCN